MTEGNKNRATLDQDKQIETCCRLDHLRACVSFAKLKVNEIISESFSHYLGCRLDPGVCEIREDQGRRD